MIVLTVALAALPIWILVFYCRNFARWDDEGFDVKYGAVFEGLRKDKRSSLAYPIILILRRFVLVFLSTVTRDMFFIQLAITVLIAVIQVAYLSNYRPFEENLQNNLEIFNEVTTIMLVDILSVFSEANSQPMDLEMDMLFLVSLVSNLSVHLYFLIKSSVTSTK